MVFETIITGMGSVVGYEFIVFILLLFSFLVMLISRGLGFTALMGTILLSAYLFNNNLIDGRQLIGDQWFVAIIIIFGLFIGNIVFQLFMQR